MNEYNYKEIQVTVDKRGVATLKLNRPNLNVMTGLMMQEITDAAQKMREDQKVRCVILTNAGTKAFCAGADLQWMESMFEANRETRIAESVKIFDMLLALYRLRVKKYLIGKAKGLIYGGGLGLLCVCNFVVVLRGSLSCFAEGKLGIAPYNISKFVLLRVQRTIAERVMKNTCVMSTKKAKKIGIVDKVASSLKNLDKIVEEEVNMILENSSEAISNIGALIDFMGGESEAQIALIRKYTSENLADNWATPDAQRKIKAFLLSKKRKK
jgi:methylglutaconyl-CoA hydratase